MSDLIKDLMDAGMCGEPFYGVPCIYCQSREALEAKEAEIERLQAVVDAANDYFDAEPEDGYCTARASFEDDYWTALAALEEDDE